jgi:hypothetical protein
MFVLRYVLHNPDIRMPIRFPIRGLKTVLEWRRGMDWSRWETNPWVVVDPVSRSSLLYLSETDYLQLCRVCITANKNLIIVATPDTVPEGPTSSGSPTPKESPSPSGYVSHLKELAYRLFNRANGWKLISNRKWSPLAFASSLMRSKIMGLQLEHLRETSLESLRPKLLRAKAQGKRVLVKILTKRIRGLELRLVDPELNSMVQLQERNFQPLLVLWFNTVRFWLGLGKSQPQTQLLQSMWKILRSHGALFLVKRLKTSLIIVNKFIGGEVLTSSDELGNRMRLAHGLPQWLPISLRILLRNRSTKGIRFVASVLNSYKGIKASNPLPDLSTIKSKDQWIGSEDFTRLSGFAKKFFAILLARLGWGRFPLPTFRLQDLSVNLSTSPSYDIEGKSSVSSARMILDLLFLIYCHGDILNRWLTVTESLPTFTQLLKMGLKSQSYAPIGRYRNPYTNKFLDATLPPWFPGIFEAFNKDLKTWNSLKPSAWVGRLALKLEPAGKTRVFAIVDNFTQCLMRPFHNLLFTVLRTIEEDATFDQDGKVRAFARNCKGPYYSYDLKEATDRIPQALYRILYTEIYSWEFAQSWLLMLTGRQYFIPFSLTPEEREEAQDANLNYSEVRQAQYTNGSFVRYVRGQPIGALSSWASLALLHHFLVQYSASSISLNKDGHFTWFKDYLILGDDIVIANEAVANSYKDTCEKFGITIGLPKSYVSEFLFNFANQTYYKGINISPASFREEIIVRSASARREMVFRLIERWYGGLIEGGIAQALRLCVTPSVWEGFQLFLQREVYPSQVLGMIRSLLDPCGSKGAQTLTAWLSTFVREPGLLSRINGHTEEQLNKLFLSKAPAVSYITEVAWGVERRLNLLQLELLWQYLFLREQPASFFGKNEDWLQPEVRVPLFELFVGIDRQYREAGQAIASLLLIFRRYSRYLELGAPLGVLHSEPRELFESLVEMMRILRTLPMVPNFSEYGLSPPREVEESFVESPLEVLFQPLGLVHESEQATIGNLISSLHSDYLENKISEFTRIIQVKLRKTHF